MCYLCRPRDANKLKVLPNCVPHPEGKRALLLCVLGAMCFARGVCFSPGRYFSKGTSRASVYLGLFLGRSVYV
jgi:hypothetical protein